MITQLITHLIDSGLFTGWAFTDWRDDSSYPFGSDVNIVLLRQQGGRQDSDIGQVGFDIFLHSTKNATPQQRGELANKAAQLDSYLANNSAFENVQYVDLVTNFTGAFKDGQERYYTAHRINLKRSGV